MKRKKGIQDELYDTHLSVEKAKKESLEDIERLLKEFRYPGESVTDAVKRLLRENEFRQTNCVSNVFIPNPNK